jgi:glycosyltransferase involved in cell wall biosynthesis
MGKSVLIIGERFFPEEFLINEVVTDLVKKGFTVSVLTQQPSYPYGKIFDGYQNKLFSRGTYQGVTVYRTAFVSGYHKSVVRKILNYLAFVLLGIYCVLIKISKHDKVLVYQTGPLTQALIGVVAKWKFRCPLYIWTWDIWPDSVFAYGFKQNFAFKFFLNGMVKFIYSRATSVWVSSPGFIEVIQRYVKEQTSFHFVPNWVQNVSPCDTGQITLSSHFNMTFTGNIGKVQNLENVILGHAKAIETDDSLYLNIVGDGSALADLKMLVEQKSIANVKFWGRRPLEEMEHFFAQSQVLIISLNSDSVWSQYIPSKFQSYLGAKKPILGVLNGAVKEMIDLHQIGLCADPASPEDIAGTMLQIRQLEEEDTLKIAQNSQKVLNQTFDRTTNLNKIADLLNS